MFNHQLIKVINGVKQIRHLSFSPLAGITRHKAAIDQLRPSSHHVSHTLLWIPTLQHQYILILNHQGVLGFTQQLKHISRLLIKYHFPRLKKQWINYSAPGGLKRDKKKKKKSYTCKASYSHIQQWKEIITVKSGMGSTQLYICHTAEICIFLC